MKYDRAALNLTFLLSILLALIPGCGGGGGQAEVAGPQMTSSPPGFAVSWGGRSRQVTAPSSALSVVATLSGAAADGTDLILRANRHADPAAYTETISFTAPARVGTWPLSIRFYSSEDLGGSVVGTADASVTLLSDGTGIGDVATTGTVAGVEVVPGQSVNVGETRQLLFTARDSAGGVLALTPGSAVWVMTSGKPTLLVQPDGQATGLDVEKATVKVTVDGKTSPLADVAVTTDINITVTPVTVEMSKGQAQQFSAAITGVPAGKSSAVIWSVKEAAGGTITAEGFYSAALEAGVFHVVATSAYDRRKRSEAEVTVTANGGIAKAYDLVVIGEGSASGINNQGVAVGVLVNPDHIGGKPFVYSNGSLRTLPVLVNGFSAFANKINDAGLVVGTAQVSDSYTHAVIWQNDQIFDLGTLGGPMSEATGVNGLGEVIGNSSVPNRVWTQLSAFSWKQGKMTEIPPPPGFILMEAHDINNSGVVAIRAFTDGYQAKGFLWAGGQLTEQGWFEVYAINDLQHFTGRRYDIGGRAYISREGVVTYFSVPTGLIEPQAINRYDTVVGNYNGVAMICSAGVVTVLNNLIDTTAGWSIGTASDINDAGVIAATAFKNGNTNRGYAVLLAPRP
jgi:probable HAF family extracellular repeat protein